MSNLQIGDSIIIADLNTDGSYTITQDEDEVIASILPPTVDAEVTPEEESTQSADNEEVQEA